MSGKKALIIGVAGQDGAYLAHYLIAQGYEVHGLVRWDSDVQEFARLGRLPALGVDIADVQIHYGDVLDAHGILSLVQDLKPDELYNLAAVSHVAESFKTPSFVMDVIIKGTLNCLEAIARTSPYTWYYQASSSEMFGDVPAPQNEDSPMHPRSPYGVAKLAAYHLVCGPIICPARLVICIKAQN